MDSLVEQVDNKYQAQFEQTQALEEEVKTNQLRINSLRASILSKKKSLKTYEAILRQAPVIDDST